MHSFSLETLIKYILDWSEVWALFIPLYIVLVVSKRQPALIKPVIIYLWLALVINLLADIIADFKTHLPTWAFSNNPLYNIHSLVRFACFSYFFITIEQQKITYILKLLPAVLLLFVIINFAFFEDFFDRTSLSGNLLTVESYLLLIYCMLYYLARLRDEDERIADRKDFWIVTGLSLYVVFNFFLFLFYKPLVDENPMLAVRMWNVHNIAYIIFCVLIAKAFYVPDSN